MTPLNRHDIVQLTSGRCMYVKLYAYILCVFCICNLYIYRLSMCICKCFRKLNDVSVGAYTNCWNATEMEIAKVLVPYCYTVQWNIATLQRDLDQSLFVCYRSRYLITVFLFMCGRRWDILGTVRSVTDGGILSSAKLTTSCRFRGYSSVIPGHVVFRSHPLVVA